MIGNSLILINIFLLEMIVTANTLGFSSKVTTTAEVCYNQQNNSQD
jgi:hypothetical protein